MVLVKHFSRIFTYTTHDLLVATRMHLNVIGDVVNDSIYYCPKKLFSYVICLLVVDLIATQFYI